MKIAVSATSNDLEVPIDPRFGRCPYFILVETEEGKIAGHEAIENPAVGAVSGAEIQAAESIGNKGIEILITGNIDSNAFQALSNKGIKIISGVTGTIKEAIEKYLRGELKETTMAEE
jgi:predicted Fe-Mo cluster-binding NifX family protein